MKNGLILAALGCVVLGGFVGWAIYARAQAPAPAPSNPANHVASSPNTAARPSEPLAVEPQAQKETPAPAAQPKAAPAAKPAQPAPLLINGFLPYPNAGETDFKLKYADLSLDELAQAKAILQELVNDETRRIADERFAKGLYEERILDPRNPGAQVQELKPPEGLGEVRSIQRTDMQAGGKVKNQTTWLTQSENPELFAHQAELQFLSSAWKQAGGH